MSTDYDAGYKAGVEQATQPLYITGEDFSHIYHPREVNEKIGERRKSLLTQKVTRYLNVFKHGDSLNPSSFLCKTKEEADRDPSPYKIGTYTIEIEIPL